MQPLHAVGSAHATVLVCVQALCWCTVVGDAPVDAPHELLAPPPPKCARSRVPLWRVQLEDKTFPPLSAWALDEKLLTFEVVPSDRAKPPSNAWRLRPLEQQQQEAGSGPGGATGASERQTASAFAQQLAVAAGALAGLLPSVRTGSQLLPSLPLQAR